MTRKSKTMRPPRRSPSAKEDPLILLRHMVSEWLKSQQGPMERFSGAAAGLDLDSVADGLVRMINRGYLAVQVVDGDLSGDFEYTIVETPKGARAFRPAGWRLGQAALTRGEPAPRKSRKMFASRRSPVAAVHLALRKCAVSGNLSRGRP